MWSDVKEHVCQSVWSSPEWSAASICGHRRLREPPSGPRHRLPPTPPRMRANYERWRTEFKTWNRWGAGRQQRARRT